MQFALLFLSLERLSKHFNLTMTWLKIFTKPYLIQVILSVTWVILIALLVTFMLIRKQFSFNFVKDRVESLAPPLVGDVVSRLASRRYHCSIDGRLSSLFKTLIIVLFVVLIVKPIIFSLGFNLLSPFCCKKKKIDSKDGEHRTTALVTIFLVLNLVFSFPFYFASMFNSVLTRIDATKDVFNLVLKICFIMRITNIIFECLAFYIFEGNSWALLSKLFYYCTCKKFPIFKASSLDHTARTPAQRELLNEILLPSDDGDEERVTPPREKKKTTANGNARSSRTNAKRPSTTARALTPPLTDEEEKIELVPQSKTPRKPKTREPLSDEDVEDTARVTKATKPKSSAQQRETGGDDDKRSKATKTAGQQKSQIKVEENENEAEDEDDDDDDDDDEEEEEEEEEPIAVPSQPRPPSRKRDEVADDEQPPAPKPKSHRNVPQHHEVTGEKLRRKSHQPEVEARVPNGKSTRHQSLKEKSSTKHSTAAASGGRPPQRRASPVREPSSASEASSTDSEPSPRPARKHSAERRRTHPTSSRSPHRSSSRKTKKHRESQKSRILNMSVEV